MTNKAFFEKNLPYEFFGKILEITKEYPAYVIIGSAGKVIGFCFLRAYHTSPVFSETAEVSYFIEKEHVGKGIGKDALALLEKEGKNRGIKYLLASILSRNEPSLRFHKRNGFTECGRLLNIGKRNGQHFDVIWMEKEIG